MAEAIANEKKFDMTFPIQKCLPPWDVGFSSIERFDTSGITSTSWITELWIKLALHWVIKKKWDSRHRIPCPRQCLTDTEPFGDYFLSLLELCIQLHGTGQFGTQYLNATEWFTCIVFEMKESGLKSNEREPSFRGKTDRIKQLRDALKDLKSDSPRNCFSLDQPHMHGLIDAAIAFAGKSDLFRQEFWSGKPRGRKSFVYAFSGFITALDKNPRLIVLGEERFRRKAIAKSLHDKAKPRCSRLAYSYI